MCPLSLLLTLALGPAAAGDVLDDKLNLFSLPARAVATKAIGRLKTSFGIDVFIETTKDGPAVTDKEKKEWFGWRKRQLRHRALDLFATEQAEKLREARHEFGGNFDGIYVVVVEENGRREVGFGAWPASRAGNTEVSWVKRDDLRKALEGGPGVDDDHALRDFLSLFEAQQREIAEPPPSPLGTRDALIVAGAFAGVWLLAVLLRWRANRNVAPSQPEPPALYQPAMLGTLLGVPAAFWVHDELFRALPPDVPPAVARPESVSLPPMPTLPGSTHATEAQPPDA